MYTNYLLGVISIKLQFRMLVQTFSQAKLIVFFKQIMFYITCKLYYSNTPIIHLHKWHESIIVHID